MIYTDDLVVCPRREISSIRGESNGMDCPEVMAHVTELTRLRVFGVVRVENCFGGPYSYVPVASRGCQAFAIRRDMATVHLEIFLFT
jgi:hypothetical protein